METLIGVIGFLLTMILIVGLIKPSAVLTWSKNPTRLKVFGYCFLSFIFLGMIATVTESDEIKEEKKITDAKNYMSLENYTSAISILREIKEGSTFYTESQFLLREADSLNNMTDNDKILANEKALKKRIENEIKSIDGGVDLSIYTGDISALLVEVGLFREWGKMIKDGENSNDEIKELTGQLKTKVSNIQVKEFPRLRKEYISLSSKRLWEENIEVNGIWQEEYAEITYTGAIFADNKNKKIFQNEIHSTLLSLRFKRSDYRWFKYDDNTTRYIVFEGKDSDILN